MRRDDGAGEPAAGGVGRDPPGRVGEHPGVAARWCLADPGQQVADQARLEIGHGVDPDRAVRVLHDHRPLEAADPGAQVHPARGDEGGVGAQPDRGVVVAAGHHDDGARGPQLHQRVLEQLDRLQRRDRAVEDVTRHDDEVRPFLPHRRDQGLDHLLLRPAQVGTVQGPAQMPVRGVHDAHVPDARCGLRQFRSATPPPR